MEQIEGPSGGTGNRIDNGVETDTGLNIRKGDGLELAEEPGVGTGDGSGLDNVPANCTGLHDGASDGMFV